MVDSSNDGGASLALDCNCCPGGKGGGVTTKMEIECHACMSSKLSPKFQSYRTWSTRIYFRKAMVSMACQFDTGYSPFSS